MVIIYSFFAIKDYPYFTIKEKDNFFILKYSPMDLEEIRDNRPYYLKGDEIKDVEKKFDSLIECLEYLIKLTFGEKLFLERMPREKKKENNFL